MTRNMKLKKIPPIQPKVLHRRRRGTKKKNRRGDLKTKVKPKASLISNKRNTAYYEIKIKENTTYCYYQNSRPTGEEGATRLSQKATRGTPHPYRPPTPRRRRGRPSLRGEGQQRKVKEARHTYAHMHDMQRTCHEHDACERTAQVTQVHGSTHTHTRIPVNGSFTKLNHIISKAIRKLEKNKANSTKVE